MAIVNIYLAGTEVSDCAKVIREGCVKNAFVSFYQFYGSKAGSAAQARAEAVFECCENVIIDSGAHSFFSQADSGVVSAGVVKNTTKLRVTPDEYFERYLEYLASTRGRWTYFVELDIGQIQAIGQAKVLGWRDRIARAGLLDRCITVYHPSVTTQAEYTRELDSSESGYVGLEGIRRNTPRLPYNSLIKEAYDRGVRVHGFAMVRQRELRLHPFYSVDSISWKAGAMWGAMPVKSRGRSLRYVRGTKAHKEEFMRAVAEAPADFFARKANANYETSCGAVYEVASRAMLSLQREVTSLWESKGIRWDDQVESRIRSRTRG